MGKRILIGIQARSTSERLPNKAMALIGDLTMLDRVVQSCYVASQHIQRKGGGEATVAVLTPEGDPIATGFRARCRVIEGPELDVLERFRVAVEELDPDYIVRITGDCPLVPATTVDYLTSSCISRRYDYLSNVDERFRTAIDGVDCEVMSRKLFDYVAETAKDPSDREHVTTLIRREPPDWAVCGVAVNYFDMSDIKFSVDTAEDLERVRKAHERAYQKYLSACSTFGKRNVIRL